MKFNFLFLILLMTSLVSASLGTFQENTCVDIRTVLNTTQTNISSISFPNNTVTYLDEPMTVNAKTFNYTFCNTDVVGTYIYDYYDLEGNVYVNDFEITRSGYKLSQAMATLYSILLLIMVGFWFLILFFTTKLPSKNQENEEGMISISNLKYLRDSLYAFLYILSAGILFLASNVALAYLPHEMFGKILFNIFMAMMYLSIPMLIIWILWIFYRLVTDKQLKSFIERAGGYTDGANL